MFSCFTCNDFQIFRNYYLQRTSKRILINEVFQFIKILNPVVPLMKQNVASQLSPKTTQVVLRDTRN